MSDTLLSVEDLWVRFPTRSGTVEAVRGISFSVGRERVGIVGESGSGKSMTGRAILRLIRAPGQMEAKSITFNGDNLLDYSERQMRKIRGHQISMVMQDPKFSLNPVHTVGKQICEALRLHTKASRREARLGALEMLEAVQIRNPERVFASYPHELSGGMGQRVMIAMMLITDPKLLIADEPTSALDVTVQMRVLAIMDKLVQERGMGLIFISHDLNLVSSFCDRIIIMYAGRIVETCKASELHNATHPYTRGLLNALPRIEEPKERLEALQRQDSWKQEASVDARV
ncbi:ABC transporter ATP-binding protein [Pseudovibrio sp. Tun.PSC04-5.I4]|uniref:ABC transporter ATP-binding protein n=1 Tax=Pseudovibrio sp. Tun.PSC04-5.I4 TaxID=1798213 RepID=UPI0008875AB8|nr:ABC transporter ATP-binding protein [Pseudovibrio sp. Tun.PSC04-5.I4]SDR33684.1 peptide/nickel transport system ATP-binding protein [Pseudovibrio sp. Tun.PSC04-5.I4]